MPALETIKTLITSIGGVEKFNDVKSDSPIFSRWNDSEIDLVLSGEKPLNEKMIGEFKYIAEDFKLEELLSNWDELTKEEPKAIIVKEVRKLSDSEVNEFAAQLKSILKREPLSFTRERGETYFMLSESFDEKFVEFGSIGSNKAVILGREFNDFDGDEEADKFVRDSYGLICAVAYADEREADKARREAYVAKQEEAAKEAKEMADFMGLPELKGGRLDVLKAVRIRREFLKICDDKEEKKAKLATTAKYWITNYSKLLKSEY